MDELIKVKCSGICLLKLQAVVYNFLRQTEKGQLVLRHRQVPVKFVDDCQIGVNKAEVSLLLLRLTKPNVLDYFGGEPSRSNLV